MSIEKYVPQCGKIFSMKLLSRRVNCNLGNSPGKLLLIQAAVNYIRSTCGAWLSPVRAWRLRRQGWCVVKLGQASSPPSLTTPQLAFNRLTPLRMRTIEDIRREVSQQQNVDWYVSEFTARGSRQVLDFLSPYGYIFLAMRE